MSPRLLARLRRLQRDYTPQCRGVRSTYVWYRGSAMRLLAWELDEDRWLARMADEHREDLAPF